MRARVQRIPTPDEIRAKMEAEAHLKANQMTQLQIAEIIAENTRLKQDNRILREELDKRRANISLGLTAHEMRTTLEKLLRENNLDPLGEIISMVQAKDAEGRYLMSMQDRADYLLEINKYRMPTLKATESTAHVQHDHRVVVVKFGDDIDKALANAKAVVDVDPIAADKEVKRLKFEKEDKV